MHKLSFILLYSVVLYINFPLYKHFYAHNYNPQFFKYFKYTGELSSVGTLIAFLSIACDVWVKVDIIRRKMILARLSIKRWLNFDQLLLL